MEGSELDTVIQVRSLTGESTTVSICSNSTIQDLKLLLSRRFPPASNSPNFHLFLKGVKLSLQSQISRHSIGYGEFMVLVPFTKKERQQTQESDQYVAQPQVSDESIASKFTDSAWCDMVKDLSSLSEISRNASQSQIESDAMKFEDGNKVSRRTSFPRPLRAGHSREFSGENHIIQSILQSSGKKFLDEQNCQKVVELLKSNVCLSNPVTGICMIREAKFLGSEIDQCVGESSMCWCPLWLKTITKAFFLLNIYSAFLQVRKETITLTGLKEVLNDLGEFGLEIVITDIEHLSQLCPKVVQFVGSEKEGKKSHDLVIVTSSMELKDHQADRKSSAVQKRLPMVKIVREMMRRKDSFKEHLRVAVKLLLCKTGEQRPKFCLENILRLVEDDATTNENERKRTRRSCSAASTSHSNEALCHGTNPLLPAEMVDHLRSGIGSRGQIVHVEEISARNANFVDVPSELSDYTKSTLKYLGVTQLYSHQRESIQATLAGKNVAVATMTSSGKSLCYNLPVLEVLSQNMSLCALYLFPTKALAQDQLRTLLSMTKGLDTSLNIGIYDGDTSQVDRLWLRDNARLLITNPDMLHISILPSHSQFRRILSNLRFVIIDEAHTYKGAFGCHTALILRRLRRLCSHVYGRDPSFVFSTATSANPREHAMELANLQTVELIHKDGSPSGSKLFVLWNPPLCLKTVPKKTKHSVDATKFSRGNVIIGRSSPIVEISRIFAEVVQHGQRCIAFCKTRKLCELVLCYTREILQEMAPSLVNSICAYRAGYIAQDRRKIEGDFFGGNLRGVAATNALELGIDVGHIDVTLHLGFPGSIASLRQQSGRSGRREKPSLAVYVAFEGPLDQYFMNFPQKLFQSPVECCHIDAKNQQVLEQHLICAALEYPVSLVHDEKYFGCRLKNAIMTLESRGYLSTDPSRGSSASIWSYIGHEKMPSRAVSIRAIEAERYKVIDKQKNEVLEEIEESKVFFQVYEGAVYMNQGKTYLVKDLDLTSKIALCQEADLKYYTKTRDYTDINVIGGDIAYPTSISNIKCSRTVNVHTCKVTTTWFGFRRIWRGSNQVFDTVELSLPNYSYESQAVWVRVPQSIKTSVESRNYSFRGGLHAAGHALLNVVPLYIICNSSDLASECVNPYDSRYIPERVLLYDSHPGGSGISTQIQPFFSELLCAALDLLKSCSCAGDTGCPNCVQSFVCQEYNDVLHKDAAIMIIQGLLHKEKSDYEENCNSSA